MNQVEHVLACWHSAIGDVVALQATHDKNTVFDVTTAGGRHVILKQVLERPDAGRLVSEYRVLNHLQAAGVPVAVPLISDEGTSFVELDGKFYTLSPALARDDTFDPKTYPEIYANMGRAIGKLHKALASYPDVIASWTMDLPGRVRNELVPFLTQHIAQSERRVFDDCVASRKDELCDALTDLPAQHIHGDCHGGNILLYHGDVSGFIDLDHLPVGPRMYDMSYLLADRVKNYIHEGAHLPEWLTEFGGLITGYESEIALTPRERRALWHGMVVTQLLFIYWFAQHENAEHTNKNFQVLNWICEHREEIETALYATH